MDRTRHGEMFSRDLCLQCSQAVELNCQLRLVAPGFESHSRGGESKDVERGMFGSYFTVSQNCQVGIVIPFYR